MVEEWGMNNRMLVLMRNFNCISQQHFILQVMSSIRDCFVTGKWEEDKDAAKLLEEDGMCKKICVIFF